MKIETKPLLVALDRVVSLASKRTSLPVLNSVKLEASHGILSVSATDLECFANACCPCEGSLPEAVCVPAVMFLGLVRGMGPTVDLGIGDGKLTMFGTGRATIGYLAGEEFPAFPSKGISLGVSTTDLADCMSQVAWAASPNDPSNHLNGAVWVKCAPKLMRVAATDRKKFAQATRALICAETELLLPVKHAIAFAEALRQDDAVLSLSDNWAVCSSPMYSIAVRLVEGTYYHLDGLLNMERQTIGEVEVKPFLDALTAVEMLSGDAFNRVEIHPAQDGIKVIYEGLNTYRTSFGSGNPTKPIPIDAHRGREVLYNFPSPVAKATLHTQVLFLEADGYVSSVALLTK